MVLTGRGTVYPSGAHEFTPIFCEDFGLLYFSFLCSVFVNCVCPLSFFLFYYSFDGFLLIYMGRRGGDRMVVGFTITYAIGAYHH